MRKPKKMKRLSARCRWLKRARCSSLKTITPEQHFTEPPPRYTEATLVKALEEKGIGRPSTYAAIMTTIQDREYVEKLEGRFHPTALGKTVNDVLIEGGFDDLFNVTYTARMEEELDHVEEGKLKWTTALHEFYDKFKDDLSKFKQYTEGIKNVDTPTDEVCLKCETKGMVQKFGRFGKYLKCLNCGATRDAEPKAGADGNAQPERLVPAVTDRKNRKPAISVASPCSSSEVDSVNSLAVRAILSAATFGRSPKAGQWPRRRCRLTRSVRWTARNWSEGSGVSVSLSPAQTIQSVNTSSRKRRAWRVPERDAWASWSSRNRNVERHFMVVRSIPTCDAVYWNKPVKEACPNCQAPFLLEKTTKKQGTFRYCANEECGYNSNETGTDIPKVKQTKVQTDRQPAR